MRASMTKFVLTTSALKNNNKNTNYMKRFPQKPEYQTPEVNTDSLWPESILCQSYGASVSIEGLDSDEEDYEWEI